MLSSRPNIIYWHNTTKKEVLFELLSYVTSFMVAFS